MTQGSPENAHGVGRAPDALRRALPGAWRLLRADAGVELAADARLDFGEAGVLRYSFTMDGQPFDLELRWRLDRDLLATSVPETGFTRETRAVLGEGEVLILEFGGPRAYFVRERD